jgi:hypothetical protein
MEKKVCEHCGGELVEFDEYGNQGWHCPKDCEFEIQCQIAQEMPPDDPEAYDMIWLSNNVFTSQGDAVPAYVQTSPCWNCRSTVFRLPEKQDYPYGHFCPGCGLSLRFHPILGQGAKYDQALRFLPPPAINRPI